MVDLHPVRTILLATDFSDKSLGAERYAVTLAANYDASLLVVHVIEPIMGYEGEAGEAEEFEEFYDRLFRRAESELAQRTRIWHESYNLNVRHHVQIGSRWQVILERAEQEDVAFIVLGRPHFQAEGVVPLGNTSQKVFFGSRRPVLFVPREP